MNKNNKKNVHYAIEMIRSTKKESWSVPYSSFLMKHDSLCPHDYSAPYILVE